MKRVGQILLALSVLYPATAFPDPVSIPTVPILSGRYTVGASMLTMDLAVPGFSIDTTDPITFDTRAVPAANLSPYTTCSPCAPGSTIELRSWFYNYVGTGTAVVDGAGPIPVRAQVQFLVDAASITAPDRSVPYLHVMEPFTLDPARPFPSWISAVNNPGITPAFDAYLTGSGFMSFDLRRTAAGLFEVEPGLTLTFGATSPTPEAAPGVLLAIGLLAFIAARVVLAHTDRRIAAVSWDLSS